MTQIKLREPFSGLSHLGGAALSAAGLLALLWLCQGKPWHSLAFAVYGASMIALYLASTFYHLLPVDPPRVAKLLMVDQVAIYLLIAGTYTPVCMLSLRSVFGWSLLAIVWGIAVVGITIRIGWRGAPVWLCIVLYVVMGWLCVVATSELYRTLSAAGMVWLAAGGAFYTIGAVCWATGRPRLWDRRLDQEFE